MLCLVKGIDFIIYIVVVSYVKVFIFINNDLYYDLLFLSSIGCIVIFIGSVYNKFLFLCSNGYWNVVLIVYVIGVFYF